MLVSMARWEGNTRHRLERAALDLFTEQGYDRTTVAQIARRANLTERSFYRWFTDKREALFGGAEELETHLVSAINAVPTGTGALQTLLAGYATAPEIFRPREFLQKRAAVIEENPPLQEREQIKQVSLSKALAVALQNRGFDQQTAQLATDIAAAIVRLASERWATDEKTDFARALKTSTADLLAITADVNQR
jgi:AcrR family transcriptional regulator